MFVCHGYSWSEEFLVQTTESKVEIKLVGTKGGNEREREREKERKREKKREGEREREREKEKRETHIDHFLLYTQTIP